MSVEFTSALEFTFSSQPYKPGLSFANWESRLQNRTFIYKWGVLGYKWDSRVTIYLTFIMITTNLSRYDKKLLQN